MKTFPDIIREASSSNLGIIALMVTALAILAYFFFKTADIKYRAAVYFVLVAGVASFCIAVIRAADPAKSTSSVTITPDSDSPKQVAPTKSPADRDREVSESKKQLPSSNHDPAVPPSEGSGMQENLVVSKLIGDRVRSLYGYPQFNLPNGSRVFTGGVHGSFSLSHNHVGQKTVSVRGFRITNLVFDPNKHRELSYTRLPQIPAHGTARAHTFRAELDGSDPINCRFLNDPEHGKFIQATCANFLEIPGGIVYTLHPTSDDVEEVVVDLVAVKAGLYHFNFAFDYTVDGQDYSVESAPVAVYKED